MLINHKPIHQLSAANDNIKADGQHEWPAFDRLRAGKLMLTPEANREGLAALVRFRHDITASEGYGEQWTAGSDSAAILEDVTDREYSNSDGEQESGQGGFGDDLVRERVTAEHLLALYLTGDLEYRRAPDGQVLPFKSDGSKCYQLEDRIRGEKGPAGAEHPTEVEGELNARYDGAVWPKAPGAAKSARHLFSGAQMKSKAPPRTWRNPDGPIVARMFSERTLAFVMGGMPSGLWVVLEATATGSSSEQIGESRGRAGKYASAVGTELQRLALESLIEIYADFDGCHQEIASQPLLTEGACTRR